MNNPTQAEALLEIAGCFSAATTEGLMEALAETKDDRLRDLVERRLLPAHSAALSALAAPSHEAAQTDEYELSPEDALRYANAPEVDFINIVRTSLEEPAQEAQEPPPGFRFAASGELAKEFGASDSEAEAFQTRIERLAGNDLKIVPEAPAVSAVPVQPEMVLVGEIIDVQDWMYSLPASTKLYAALPLSVAVEKNQQQQSDNSHLAGGKSESQASRVRTLE